VDNKTGGLPGVIEPKLKLKLQCNRSINIHPSETLKMLGVDMISLVVVDWMDGDRSECKLAADCTGLR